MQTLPLQKDVKDNLVIEMKFVLIITKYELNTAVCLKI